MPNKNLYPASRGWIRSSMTLKTSDPVDHDEVKKLCSGGKPEDYEFPIISQHCRTVKIVFRKLPEVAKREELVKLTPICAHITREVAWRGAQGVWHKDGPFYVFETWTGGAVLASVRINQLHVFSGDSEFRDEDISKLIKDTITALSHAATTTEDS